MGRDTVPNGEDPARRAMEHIARQDNGIDHEVRLRRSSTSATFNLRERTISVERTTDEAVIRPSDAPPQRNCGRCGLPGHNVRTCSQPA